MMANRTHKGTKVILLLWAAALSSVICNYTPPKMIEEPSQQAFAVEGQQLTLKCQASGNPPPKYTWHKDGKEVDLTDPRRKVDNGYLIIDNFDGQEDVGNYQCTVRVSNSKLELKLLSRLSQVTTSAVPAGFKGDIQPVTAYTGGAMRLSVDAGNFNPAPKIAWNYRGKPSIQSNDPRFTVLPSGVLQAHGLSAVDDGKIRAVALAASAGGTKSSNIVYGKFQDVLVGPATSRPASKNFYFLAEPQDVDLKWGQSVILEAMVDSATPTVQYRWSKDGQPITMDGASKSIVGQGNLKITYAKEEDSGSYKVVATSGGKSIEATANVNIMTKPQFTAVPPRRVNGYDGESVTFNFKVVGNPKPKLTWFRDTEQIGASADYVDFFEDRIVIKDLISPDSGMYQARASNAIGDAEMSLELLVLPKGSPTLPPIATPSARIPSKPQNLQITGQTDSTISLSWQPPSVTNGALDYYRIEYKSVPGSASQSKLIAATSLTTKITGLQPSTTYNVRVEATNANGDSGFTGYQAITTQAAPKPPNKVIDIKPIVSGTNVQVTWKLDASGSTPTSYKVDYTNVGTGTTKSAIVQTPTTTLTGLVPGASYSFTITPFLGTLEGISSTPMTFDIPAPTPPFKVVDVKSSVTGTDAQLTWKPDASGSTPTSYKVDYTNIGSATSKSVTVQTPTTTLTGLVPGASYSYTITPFLGTLEGVSSAPLPFDIPTVPKPGAVNSIIPIGSFPTSIKLQWNQPTSGPRPSSYRVVYKNIDSPSSQPDSRVSLIPSITIDNLQPYTEYEIYVVPIYPKGGGLESTKLRVKTEGQAPAPESLYAVLISTNTAKVRWDPVPAAKVRGFLTGYQLEYFKKGQKKQTMRTIPNIKSTVTEYDLKELDSGADYTTIVKAVVGKQKSLGSYPLGFKTNVKTDTGPYKATGFVMTQDPNQPSVIQLAWREPYYISGTMSNYLVYFKPEASSTWTTIPLPGVYRRFTISDFTPGTKYVGYIVPFDSNGVGIASTEATLTTLAESGLPPPPVQLVINPKADSLAASWQPAQSDVVVRGYYVKVIKDGIPLGTRMTFPGRDNTRMRLYNDIESETDYNVVVSSYNNFGESASVIKSATTLKAPTPAIVMTRVVPANTEMLLKWSDSKVNVLPGAPIKYIIRYTDYTAAGQPIQKVVVSDKPEVTLTGLTPYTDYDFFIKRKSDGIFPILANVNSKTLQAVPSAPLAVNSFQMDGYPTWALIDWQTPIHSNGMLLGYTVLYTTNLDTTVKESEMALLHTDGINLLYKNVTGLEKAKYQFIVYATNQAGPGVRSTPFIADLGVSTGVVTGATGADGAGGGGGFEWWWWLLLLLLLILLILLICCCIYCCCCGWCLRCCFGCCPCCKGCWYCCCLPWLLCCCPCCCDKERYEEEKLMISSPVSTSHNGKMNGASVSGIGVGAWKGGAGGAGGGNDSLEMKQPLVGDYAPSTHSGISGVGSLSRRTSKSSDAAIKVPVPGDITFISYKTSLQDYCQKVGWLAPVYSTTQFDDGFHSKVTFGGSTFDSGAEFGTSRQDAEQRAAHVALVGLGCLDAHNKYANDVSISVPTAGDASFISYKCSLHDFCQQCNILPPRLMTTNHESGHSSSVQVGSHTFNMSSRVQKSAEAEQKVACIALQGLCMMDSQSGYYPEACFTVPGPEDASFISFKSSLHDFCQKYKLPPPQYITNQGSHGYSAKLKFGGLFFQSSSHFTSRIEAEQHAAFEALQGLGLLESAVEFDSANTSGGVVISGGSVNGNGVVVGGLSSTNTASRQNSRGGSRGNSRPPSRPGSRPASRQGSLTQLNVTNQYSVNSTSYDQHDNVSQNNMGSRTFSSGSGFDGQHSLNRNGQYTADVQQHHQQVSHKGSYGRNGSVSGQSAVTQQHGNTSGSVDISSASYGTGNHNQQTAVTGQEDGDVYSFSYSNHTGSGTVPRSRSKSVEQNYDNLDGGQGFDGGVNHSMQHEQHSRSSSGYATMPRKQVSNTSNSSAHVQYSSNQSSYNTSSTSRSYSSSQHVNNSSSHSYGGNEVRGAASQPALPDLEKEMAGLEGLIKDLNGITTSGKIA